ncbi:carbohydrate porin [Sphingomonas sp. ZT3P38]|uniref:carbohydrate porin n=1 Tax=Parasphingomonas zepuensis TaxID=3096161 RepID=UPI002FCB5594
MRGAAALVAAGACLSSPAAAEERAPVTLGATYVTDILTVADGGMRRGTVWLGRADVTATIDGRVFGIDGAELFFDVMGVNGPDFSGRYVGDAQTVSNVQADSPVRPYEAWLSVPVGAGLTVKGGLVDLNNEFDMQEVGDPFLNSSFGVGPDFSQSGVNGPSIFPATATAIMLRYEDKDWTGRFAVFDAVAGAVDNPRRTVIRLPGERGALLIGEVERKLPGDARIQLGLWHYTTRFDRIDLDAPGTTTSHGGYALVEGKLAERGKAALRGWARIGLASPEANQIGLYLGGGATWGDKEQQIGLAVAHARLGNAGRRAAIAAQGRADRAETTIELTYALPLTSWVTVQPDVQYVIHPGWMPALHNALVAGMRFSFAIETE